jgi:hypothetical protein
MRHFKDLPITSTPQQIHDQQLAQATLDQYFHPRIVAAPTQTNAVALLTPKSAPPTQFHSTTVALIWSFLTLLLAIGIIYVGITYGSKIVARVKSIVSKKTAVVIAVTPPLPPLPPLQ